MDDRRAHERISVAEAARLLGLGERSLYRMGESGALGGLRTYGVTAAGRPRRRRSLELTREHVDELIERARVKPGTLRHLHLPALTPPDDDLARIERFCAEVLSPIATRERVVRSSVRGVRVTISVGRRRPRSAENDRRASRLAQLRYRTPSQSWSVYHPDDNDKWLPWRDDADLAVLLDLVRNHALGMLGG